MAWVQHGTAPDHRRFVLREKAHRNKLDAVFLGRPDHLAVHLQLRLQAEHVRHIRPVDVAVEHADAGAQFREGHGQVHRHRGLADTTLAGADRDHVLHTGQRRLAVFRGRRRPHRKRHGHADAADARHGGDRGAGALADVVAGRHRRTRQLDGDGRASVHDLDVFHELERHHVRAQVGVVHTPQRSQDQFRCHQKFSLPCRQN